MSVRLWDAEDLGNVARFLVDVRDIYGALPQIRKHLATVSRANVAEFMETYQGRHGTPSPVTEQEIAAWTPTKPDEQRARSVLALLSYNALTTDVELRTQAERALTYLLSRAMIRLNELERIA